MLRNEIKYLLNYEDYVLLSRRLFYMLEKDSHSVCDEGYRITSLYLDDINQTSYYEKLSGDTNRKKYRLRAYNLDSSFISLECKEKKQNKIDKTSVRIDKNIFDGIVKNDYELLYEKKDGLSKSVIALNREKLLSPVAVVDYVREAYTHPLSNTRITFDKELSVGINTFDFFERDYQKANVFDKNQVILEVKYDDYLPTFISQLLSIGYKPMAQSKFLLCYEYLKNKNIIIKMRG